MSRHLFALGTCVYTPGALAALDDNVMRVFALLGRHATGDWGDLDAHDRAMNAAAINNGERILSAYRIGVERFYVITEADRSSTTVLLAEEY